MPTALTIDELFTPAPSGVIPSSPGAVPDSETWLGTELATGVTIGLSTTAWNPGDPSRTILSINAVGQAMRDGNVSLMAQAGFLDWAATGTVTYETAPAVVVTVPVTPDPSNPAQNPTGAPGWLDVLANEVYDVQREPATFASGPVYLVNESGSTYSFSAGTAHVANAQTAQNPAPTYSNTSAISLTPSPNTSITSGTIVGTLVTLNVGSTTGIVVGSVIFVDGTGNASIDKTWQVAASVPSGTQLQFISATASGSVGSTGKVYVPASFPFQADVVGPASNAVSGAITTLITTQIGVECFNSAPFIGANWESNTSLVQRCRLRLGALSPSGPKNAYVYFALTASQILSDEAISVPLAGGGTAIIGLQNGPITGALEQLDTTTGIVTVTIANAAGTTQGATNVPIIGATTASPIVVHTGTAHLLGAGGGYVYIAGVQGLSGVNGYFHATFVDSTHFSLDGSTGTGTYTTGGSAEVGDLGMVDLIVQDNALPDLLTEVTQWAATTTCTVAATVYVPIAQVSNYQIAVATALSAYFATLPIGGVLNVESNNVVPIGAIEGLLYSAGISGSGGSSYVRSVTGVTLNGVATDLVVSATTKVLQSGGISSITVVGV